MNPLGAAVDPNRPIRTKSRTYTATVTGTMGNTDPANAAASTPGEVYFAISTKDGTTPYHLSMPAQPTRLAYKLAVAKEIADVLTEII